MCTMAENKLYALKRIFFGLFLMYSESAYAHSHVFFKGVAPHLIINVDGMRICVHILEWKRLTVLTQVEWNRLTEVK